MLAGLNPDKSIASLNQRLDLIEQRFSEALSQVARRSDVEGLRLIEANVMELAAHVEQTRGRLDRIDAIDEQVRGIARRLEESDHQRLAALETLLQDYMAEWRRSEERTATTLRTLEDTVNRMGETVEAMDALKPVPDLSLSMLEAPGAGIAAERDPLSHVYADAAHTHQAYRAPLDAADYAPRMEAQVHAPSPFPAPASPLSVSQPEDAGPSHDPLPPPAVRASAIRAKLRQAQLLAGDVGDEAERGRAAPKAERAASPAPQRARPGVLLAAGVTLFAAGGYLLVDVLTGSPTLPGGPAGIEQGARSTDVKAARAAADDPAEGAGAPNRRASEKDATPPQQEAPHKAPGVEDQTGEAEPAPASKFVRVNAIGSAIAAVFRGKAPAAAPPVETTASIPTASPAPEKEAAAVGVLPMTIGPASLRQAAVRGDTAAQLEVAARFAAGVGVARDLQQALQWYGRAAAQGMAVAQYRLGALHERGLGTPADAERARAWYARAAEQGNVKAMHNLAVLSVSGGRSDYATAAKWFAKAADFGLADSQFNLAILHQNGLGVNQDQRLAYQWLALAARGGDREAAGRLAQVKAKLGPSEAREGDTIVAAWRPHRPDPAANEMAEAAAPNAGQ